MEKARYPGEPEVRHALELVREHVAAFPCDGRFVPFKVDASFHHDRLGRLPCVIAITTVDSPYHIGQCFKISMAMKASQFDVDSTISIGESGAIMRFLNDARHQALVQAILADTFRNIVELDDRSGIA